MNDGNNESWRDEKLGTVVDFLQAARREGLFPEQVIDALTDGTVTSALKLRGQLAKIRSDLPELALTLGVERNLQKLDAILHPVIPPKLDRVREIFGTRFVETSDVGSTFNFFYEDGPTQAMLESLPGEDYLAGAAAAGCVLIAGPPRDLTLLEVLELGEIAQKEGRWYTSPRQTFSRNDCVKANRFLLIRGPAFPKSIGKSWNGQLKLLKELPFAYVPNIAEAVYAALVMREVRKYYLFSQGMLRTSSQDESGDYVIVGQQTTSNLEIDFCRSGKKDGKIGLLTAMAV